jgi:pimeloyl-ACP methyl ester carboxylesterase
MGFGRAAAEKNGHCDRREADRLGPGAAASGNGHARHAFMTSSISWNEQLHDVVLVGHSYAGLVITGVAEHARDRIRDLVYVDALVPENGQSGLQLCPQPTRDTFRKLADEGGGWRMRPNDHLLHLWGLEEGLAREFVKARLCDFTIRCFEQPLNAPTGAASR